MSHLDYEINKELGECYLFMGEKPFHALFLLGFRPVLTVARPVVGLSVLRSLSKGRSK